MFLELLRRRNPRLIECAVELHQAGRIPSNAYIIDTDAVELNANCIMDTARKCGMDVLAMTKQVGRNAAFCEAIAKGGIRKAVAVDMHCARAVRRAGLALGHIGHLVQVPRHEADAAAALSPEYWTVFSLDKAREAGAAAGRLKRVQPVLARIVGDGDTFYRGHEGGFPASDIRAIAASLDKIPHVRFAGITSFPTQLYDSAKRKVLPTKNLATLRASLELLVKDGREGLQLNAPGTTSSQILSMLAEAGVTQVEPGHGLTGTTPLHAVVDLPETPAIAYVTEISHTVGSEGYCFGGGLYIDPVFAEYQVRAFVTRDPDARKLRSFEVEIPLRTSIDYYGMVRSSSSGVIAPGDTVIFGFRAQAFVTRAYVVGVAGISRGMPSVVCITDSAGRLVTWP